MCGGKTPASSARYSRDRTGTKEHRDVTMVTGLTGETPQHHSSAWLKAITLELETKLNKH
jgi:hypothetical protein